MRIRRKIVLTALVLAVGFCYAFIGYRFMSSERSLPPERYAYVERVVDGDTVVLAGSDRVRYIGIDTPELNHPHKGREPFAQEAADLNRRLVEGKMVRLVFDVEKRDKYGRMLAYVWQDGIFVNEELVREGLARTYSFPPNTRYENELEGAERAAMTAGKGVWGQ